MLICTTVLLPAAFWGNRFWQESTLFLKRGARRKFGTNFQVQVKVLFISVPGGLNTMRLCQSVGTLSVPCRSSLHPGYPELVQNISAQTNTTNEVLSTDPLCTHTPTANDFSLEVVACSVSCHPDFWTCTEQTVPLCSFLFFRHFWFRATR